jgi:hypothetical protein
VDVGSTYLKLLILVFCVCCYCSDYWCLAVINVAVRGFANRAILNPESTVETVRLKEARNGDGLLQRDHDVVCLRLQNGILLEGEPHFTWDV